MDVFVRAYRDVFTAPLKRACGASHDRDRTRTAAHRTLRGLGDRRAIRRHGIQQLTRHSFIDFCGVTQLHGVAHQCFYTRSCETQLYLRLWIAGLVRDRRFLDLTCLTQRTLSRR